MASKSGTLYIGVTSDLARRVYEHKNKFVPGFTSRYNCTRLLYYETGDSPDGSIARVALIGAADPQWIDLGVDLGIDYRDPSLRSG